MKVAANKWRNFAGKVFNESITTLVENAIVKERKAGHKLKICVGSDSQVYKTHVAYGTAIVILREGKGGFTLNI